MSRIANAYAQGLYSLACEEGLSKIILDEMAVLDCAFTREPDYLRLLAAPNLSKEERCQILDDSFRGQIRPYLLNFLKILTEKGYIRHFSECCKVYRRQYHLDHGILPVRAVTAVPMTAEQQTKLTEKLEKITGKTIELSNPVDATCLGGVRLEYDGKQVDGTVQNRLQSIRNLLQKTVL